MKAIVFGGAGFLGSHVADELTSRGYSVTVFDRKPSAYLKNGQKSIVGDITCQEDINKAVVGHDIVYNFAGEADITNAHANPLETVKSNIMGTTLLLEAAKKNRIKRFVFASTLYVYSSAGSFYRVTKQACELLVENYQEAFGLPFTILRYGSLYGPRADDSNFICAIIKQALHKGQIVREGDGEEIREYIHVSDAAKCSVDILSPAYANQSVMIAGMQPIKIKDLLMMVREILHNKVNVKYIRPTSNYHYEITPYNFTPKPAKRIISDTYTDLGQGILSYIQDIYGESAKIGKLAKGCNGKAK